MTHPTGPIRPASREEADRLMGQLTERQNRRLEAETPQGGDSDGDQS